jgi:prophage regulatory protein
MSNTFPRGAIMADNLLRLPAVLQKVPWSRSTLYVAVRDGKFPRPVQLGPRSVAWSESAVDEWIEARKSAVA